jgi:hypothetical protein
MACSTKTVRFGTLSAPAACTVIHNGVSVSVADVRVDPRGEVWEILRKWLEGREGHHVRRDLRVPASWCQEDYLLSPPKL